MLGGDRFVRRGRGRTRSEGPRETVAVRLDQDVPERLRAPGPGWQSRINRMLRRDFALSRLEADRVTSVAAPIEGARMNVVQKPNMWSREKAPFSSIRPW